MYREKFEEDYKKDPASILNYMLLPVAALVFDTDAPEAEGIQILKEACLSKGIDNSNYELFYKVISGAYSTRVTHIGNIALNLIEYGNDVVKEIMLNKLCKECKQEYNTAKHLKDSHEFLKDVSYHYEENVEYKPKDVRSITIVLYIMKLLGKNVHEKNAMTLYENMHNAIIAAAEKQHFVSMFEAACNKRVEHANISKHTQNIADELYDELHDNTVNTMRQLDVLSDTMYITQLTTLYEEDGIYRIVFWIMQKMTVDKLTKKFAKTNFYAVFFFHMFEILSEWHRDVIYNLAASFDDKKCLQGDIEKAKETYQDESANEIAELKEQVAKLEAEVKEQKEKIAALQSKNIALQSKVNNVTTQFENYKKTAKTVKSEHTELVALRDYMYRTTQQSSHMQFNTTKSELNTLGSKHVIFIGGQQALLTKLRDIFPKWTYIDPTAFTTYNKQAITNADLIILHLTFLSHAAYYKFAGVINTYDLKVCYCFNSNIEMIEQQAYDTLVEKK